jgi:hypothetical protein
MPHIKQGQKLSASNCFFFFNVQRFAEESLTMMRVNPTDKEAKKLIVVCCTALAGESLNPDAQFTRVLSSPEPRLIR